MEKLGVKIIVYLADPGKARGRVGKTNYFLSTFWGYRFGRQKKTSKLQGF